MRARQFLSLSSPLMVRREEDGQPLVLLAFVIDGGLFGGRIRAMTKHPTEEGPVEFPTIESLSFPAALAAGPVMATEHRTLGELSRAERRAQGRRN